MSAPMARTATLRSGFTPCYTLTSGETNNSVDAGVFRQAPGIEIVKDATQAIVSPNRPVTFTDPVKNTGGVALSDIAVTDGRQCHAPTSPKTTSTRKS